MAIYCTSYCNKGHIVEDGRPVKHECYVLPAAALKAEMSGDFRSAQGAIEAAKPLRLHKGVRR